jgi:hypothetical protein
MSSLTPSISGKGLENPVNTEQITNDDYLSFFGEPPNNEGNSENHEKNLKKNKNV